MKTKEQKSKEIKLGRDLISKNQSLIFIDFTGIPTASVNKLKKDLKSAGGQIRIFKKRLLAVAMKKSGLDFDPVTFTAQVAGVFAKGDVSSIAGIIHKFQKEVVKDKKVLNILGAYEINKKNFLDLKAFTEIAKLPSREVLLQLLMGAITGPIRKMMYTLDEVGKKK